jgi:uncharacterized membrane protein
VKTIAKYAISGIVTIIPLWVTWLVVDFVFRLLLRVSTPIVNGLRDWMQDAFPGFSAQFHWPVTEKLFAISLTIVLLLFIGWSAHQVFGRRLLGWLETSLDRIPVVKSVYGGVRKLIAALQTPPGEGGEQQRVVMINFPSDNMKTIGLLTRTMTDSDSGRKLAIVYVPTTPNPTSGYIEIVPMEHVVSTDWTLDEAMNFIITAGAVAPARPIRYANRPAMLAAQPHA